MEELQKLEKQKLSIESEIETLVQFLTEDGMPGISGSLLDADGFPRQDVDVYAIRGARHRLACLRTDYAQICAEIEAGLHKLHSQSCVAVPRPSPPPRPETRPKSRDLPRPFAWLDEVSSSSAADAAGLRAGDRVIVVGDVFLRGDTPSGTDDTCGCDTVAECFQQLCRPNTIKPGVPIRIRVARGNPEVLTEVVLTPGEENGRARLGCHLTPL